MALAAPSSLRCLPTTPPHVPSPPCASRLRSRPLREPRLWHRLVAAAAAAATAPLASSSTTADTERRKHELLRAVQETRRGFAAGPDQRAAIEEAVLAVEERGAGEGTPLDLAALDGTWRLCYTSASDVLVLFEAAERLPPLQVKLNNVCSAICPNSSLQLDAYLKPLPSNQLQMPAHLRSAANVGQIYQKFECKDRSDGGIVRNVVRWSILNLLEEEEGATLMVSAKFVVLSKRNIFLQFEEVAVENIKISEQLQALIAPAILPRSFLSLQILQFLKTFRAQVPVSGPERRSPGGLYYLSYLDRDMLLGRSVGGGGVFVFTKAQPLT
ncbi:probable plastid-lipid-associated protein 10, chloroplastic isoform X1 [Miscanthus floridulus]|uniref:probable plastid-lipid-associated protein 10, chloroplastic isoform X1 n=1 Tax=Miscanthus floridulus TaxID=154761 RepID=UPI00345ACE88